MMSISSVLSYRYVILTDTNGKKGVVDIKGGIVIPVEYEEIELEWADSERIFLPKALTFRLKTAEGVVTVQTILPE